jgi:hypothetical protein
MNGRRFQVLLYFLFYLATQSSNAHANGFVKQIKKPFTRLCKGRQLMFAAMFIKTLQSWNPVQAWLCLAQASGCLVRA